MICGGTNIAYNADKRCIGIDFSAAAPTWTLAAPMLTARVMPLAVNLPDGTIFMAGGADYGIAGGNPGQITNAKRPVFASEIYNPLTKT